MKSIAFSYEDIFISGLMLILLTGYLSAYNLLQNNDLHLTDQSRHISFKENQKALLGSANKSQKAEAAPKLQWREFGTHTIGVAGILEANAQIPDNLKHSRQYVVTGFGASVREDNLSGIILEIGRIDENNRIVAKRVIRAGSQPQLVGDLFVSVAEKNETVVGLGLQVKNGRLQTIELYSRKLNPTSGRLEKSVHKTVVGEGKTDKTHVFEGQNQSIILTGVGVGVRNDQIEILQLKFAELIGE